MSPATMELPADALVTVGGKIPLTLDDAGSLADDELANVVIGMCQKIRDMLPYIVILKERFDAGERDSLNRLRSPIKGCHSWGEFCRTYLNRTSSDIKKVLAADKKAKEKGRRELTDADVAEYEQEHPEIRQFTQNLLADLPPADVVSVLVNQEHPEPMAEAIVKIVVAENNEAQKPSKTSELKDALEQHIAKARELMGLFDDAEVTRSAKADCFHLTLRDLTEAEVRNIAGMRKS